MIAKYPGPCKNCGATIPKGALCAYDGGSRTISHFKCPDTDPWTSGEPTEAPDAQDKALKLAFDLKFSIGEYCGFPECTEHGLDRQEKLWNSTPSEGQ